MSQTVSEIHAALSDDDVQAVDRLGQAHGRLCDELARVVVGQRDTIDQLLVCLFARRHALLMGVPGLAKTLLVSKLAETMSLKFSRIQFTPDLMPMDITGTDILQDNGEGRREFQFVTRPGLRQHHFGRRNQSCSAKDASGDAGGDAGTTRHGRRQEFRSAATVHGAGDAESGRARRHLSVARSAARSLHVVDRIGLSRRKRKRSRSRGRPPGRRLPTLAASDDGGGDYRSSRIGAARSCARSHLHVCGPIGSQDTSERRYGTGVVDAVGVVGCRSASGSKLDLRSQVAGRC